MMIIRKIPALKIIIAIAVLYSHPVSAAKTDLNTFIDKTVEIDATQLEKLARTVEANPTETANYLQSHSGGRKALQRYASAMLASGQAERLGRQWAELIVPVDRVGKAEYKDGGVWYPHAADAGFFAGGLAVALSQYPQSLQDFSSGAGLTEPISEQDIAEWFTRSVRTLSRPARSAFSQSLRAAAFQ